jgi:hypothetical protein
MVSYEPSLQYVTEWWKQLIVAPERTGSIVEKIPSLFLK